MSDSEQRGPQPQRTLSIGQSEIDEREPTIRVVPDSGDARTYLLVQKLLDVGSEARQDIALQYPGISPRHARLTLEGGTYRVYDLTGKKGVLVNHQPIDSQLLHDNDVVRLQNPGGQGVTITYYNPVERSLSAASVGRS